MWQPDEKRAGEIIPPGPASRGERVTKKDYGLKKGAVLARAEIALLYQVNITHQIAIWSSALPVVAKLSRATVSSNSCRRVKSPSG
jgi:hypothetical protein